ncbi:MAG: glucose-6-phosphate isomerase [Oscillospiraceae bacterium]|nr:glucose-6-phosphate isomerase [Oscillospiraceae bacterium]
MKFELDISKTFNFINEKELTNLEPVIKVYHDFINSKQGVGNDFLGWSNLPVEYNEDEFERIKILADKIKNKCDVLVNIGIGGSYLGAKAAIELFSHSFFDLLKGDKKNGVKVIFAGNNMSSKYLSDLMDAIEDKDVCLNVISKSGTTTEPAIAFRILKDFIERKYGLQESKNRIFITTDKEKGTLKSLADKEGYETFVIPDDVGGRYSVLTAVGLLPMAASGIDITSVMEGARDAYDEFSKIYCEDSSLNICYKYAAVRNSLYRKGKLIEVLSNFEPSFQYFGEWWKQLFGESEGKDGKGIFPVSCNFSTDLHSMGQYIQDGLRNFFETFINVAKSEKIIEIGEIEGNIDGLNFLKGKNLHYVNSKAFLGTLYAHYKGNVPCIVLNMPEVSERAFGYLIYFFEKACAMSGFLLGVNPFDQPGVENYKNNMFSLLGKPGYAKLEFNE